MKRAVTYLPLILLPVVLLPLLLILASRGDEAAAPTPAGAPKASAATQPQRQPTERELRIAEEAAAALKLYYRAIEAGDYRSAYRMRTQGRVDEARFAANYAAYEHFRAVVGAPSFPADADGFTYVQMPVMITGRFKGGKPFGSSGNVMVRRPTNGAAGSWKVLAES